MTNVKKFKDEVAIELFRRLVDKLDELDLEDFFGSEGWKHYMGMEDDF
jgi:hypothetical protein